MVKLQKPTPLNLPEVNSFADTELSCLTLIATNILYNTFGTQLRVHRSALITLTLTPVRPRDVTNPGVWDGCREAHARKHLH